MKEKRCHEVVRDIRVDGKVNIKDVTDHSVTSCNSFFTQLTKDTHRNLLLSFYL
jgi:hypothetical protein